MRIQSIVLENHGDISVLRSDIVNQSVAYVQLAVGDFLKTCDHTKSSGFSAAGRTYKYNKFLVLYFQAEVGYRNYAAGILFAYFTNRSMVFKSQNKTAAAKTAEFIQFAVSRVATLFVDMGIVWLLCDRLEVMRSTPASCVASAVVIVLNYFASRFIVFKKKGEKRENGEKESQ